MTRCVLVLLACLTISCGDDSPTRPSAPSAASVPAVVAVEDVTPIRHWGNYHPYYQCEDQTLACVTDR